MEGGCLCGAVRYRVEGEGLLTAVCHCTHCQKQAGSAFSIIVGVRAKSLEVEGELTTFKDQGASGKALDREFCPKCGSPLFSKGEASPGIVFVKAGTLDDTSSLSPQMELWTQSEQPWVKLGLQCVRHPGQPG